MTIARLNHAVLYVRDAERAATFYRDVLGFEVAMEMPGAVFLRGGASDNHHDLGLFSVGDGAPGPQPGRVGLYHLAWQVATIEELAEVAQTLQDAGALVGASDHGVTKSLYAKDLDGNEFEIMFEVPRETWTPELATTPILRPLDLQAEVARWGSPASN
jgi:catechol-2,3-dioxygenase